MSNEPQWEHYRTLLAVLETGSLSGAARALGLAQPTTRRHIEQLEGALEAPLFTRSSNGLHPTARAQQARPYAEAIAATARALERELRSDPDRVAGTVRVTCSEVVAAEVLPRAVAAMYERHPELHLEIAASNENLDLLRRDADVAIRMVAPTQSGLVRKKIGRVELGFFAHPAYLESREAPACVRELHGHALVGADRSRAWFEAAHAIGVPSDPSAYAFRSDSDLVQLSAVRAGLGIGVCQVPLSRGPVSLVRVLPDVAAHLELWLVAHEDLRDTPRIRAVFDGLGAGLRAYLA